MNSADARQYCYEQALVELWDQTLVEEADFVVFSGVLGDRKVIWGEGNALSCQ